MQYSIPGIMKTAVSSTATSAAGAAYSLAESGSSSSCRGGGGGGGGGALAFGPGKPRTSPEPGQRGLRPSPPSNA